MLKLYVVVAKNVAGKEISHGRAAAQAAHVALSFAYTKFSKSAGTLAYTPTIVLQARDEKELAHIAEFLDLKKIPLVTYWDEDIFYGTKAQVNTALATVVDTDFQEPLYYLPLW